MFRYILVAVLLGVSAGSGLAQSSTGTSQDVDVTAREARFCVVPVENGAPTEADVGSTWRITNTAFRIPGLPAIVFTPTNRGGQWTINAERRLVPYVGAFPGSYLDKNYWVLEPWSGRIVAITWGGGISTLQPGADHFEAFNGREYSTQYGGIQTLPRRKLTIVISKGVPLVVEEKSLRPWLSQDELTAQGIRGVSFLRDAPSLSAIILVDTDSRIHILSDDDSWQQVGSVEARDYGPVFEVLDAGAVVFLGQKSVVAIRKNSADPKLHSAERLLTTRANGASTRYPTSRLFHQVLIYDGGGLIDLKKRWRRLGPNGFEDLPGGDIGLPAPSLFPFGRIHDLPTLGKTLFEGANGLFLYDGHALTPVVGGEKNRIGELPRVYDLPSIKRVILTTRNGLFELTAEGHLVARPMPFPADGLPQPTLRDWPESSVALISSIDGVFALDGDFNASKVDGGDLVELAGSDFSEGTNPGTGEMVLKGSRGLFLAVDSRRSPDTCRQARKTVSVIPESNICLAPVQGSESTNIGFAVGDLIDAPGGKGILFDTVSGLYLLGPDDTIAPLQPRGGQFTRSLKKLPWVDEIVAVGVNDTVIRSDLSLLQLAHWQYSDLRGVLPSMRAVLVLTDTGGGLQKIQALQSKNGGYGLIDTGLRRTLGDAYVGAPWVVDAPWLGTPLIGKLEGLFGLNQQGHSYKFLLQGSAPERPIRLPPLPRSMHFFSVPRFETIYVWHNSWFRISADRQWLPLTGLPPKISVLAVYDPGVGDALFGTTAGIYAVSKGGVARPVTGDAAPRRSIRTFAPATQTGWILAGGDEGLFEIQRDPFTISQITNGSDGVIGSVQRIVNAPFAGLSIIEAANGTYALEHGKLSLIGDLAAAGTNKGVISLNSARRVLAVKKEGAGPLISELARRNFENRCTSRL